MFSVKGVFITNSHKTVFCYKKKCFQEQFQSFRTGPEILKKENSSKRTSHP